MAKGKIKKTKSLDGAAQRKLNSKADLGRDSKNDQAGRYVPRPTSDQARRKDYDGFKDEASEDLEYDKVNKEFNLSEDDKDDYSMADVRESRKIKHPGIRAAALKNDVMGEREFSSMMKRSYGEGLKASGNSKRMEEILNMEDTGNLSPADRAMYDRYKEASFKAQHGGYGRKEWRGARGRDYGKKGGKGGLG